MKLKELKQLLEKNSGKNFQIQLPDNSPVPLSFHITEVGFVTKTFIDCGGKIHTVETCQLQAWVGPDVDHRIEAGKMASILDISARVLPHEFLEVEIEYGQDAVSQYPVTHAEVSEEAVILHLTTKQTDCLAKELCLLPSGCGPAGCC